MQRSIQDSVVLQDVRLPRQVHIPKVMVRGEELCNFSERDWTEVQKAFKNHGNLPFHQWWKEIGDADFESGSLQIGWKGDKIYLLLSMEDQSIVTTAQRNGEKLWELGDAVGIFIKSPQASEYYEVQVAPNGCTLQLKYPDVFTIANLRDRGMAGLDKFILNESPFDIHLQVAEGVWNILVEVPGELLFFNKDSLLGRACQISVSRYDHWEDARPPSLSSTSPHWKVDFHQQKDWGWAEFVAARTSC